MKSAIDRLAAGVPNVDIRKLEGVADEWAIRVGRWRIRVGFRPAERTIDALQVLHRRETYRERGWVAKRQRAALWPEAFGLARGVRAGAAGGSTGN